MGWERLTIIRNRLFVNLHQKGSLSRLSECGGKDSNLALIETPAKTNRIIG